MTVRKPEQNRSIGLKDIEDIGVPKAEKEPWEAVAKRIGASDTAQSRTETQEDN